MRVLHCFKTYRPDNDGGIEEAMSRILAGAPAETESAILACRIKGLGSTITVDGVSVERTTTFSSISSLPVSPTYPWRFQQRARSADVIVFHAPFPLVDLAVRFGLRDDQAFVIHWHAEIVGRDWWKLVHNPLIRHSIARADRILVTHAAIIDASPHLPAAREKCHVVPYGIDTRWWSDLTASDQLAIGKLRQQYPSLISACGRLVPYKGFDVLVRAMKQVDAHLVIVGRGPLEAELRDLAGKEGVGERITFAGFLDRTEQRRILHASRVFVLPSVNEAEAFGIVQIEAMCCGLPVVNTLLPTAVPHVARHQQEGLTVAPGDPPALAAALGRLLEDQDLAQRLGRQGRARACENFDWKTFAAAADQNYRDALRSRRGCTDTIARHPNVETTRAWD